MGSCVGRLLTYIVFPCPALSFLVSDSIYNPSEACAVMYDFPRVPRRSTEAAAARLVPYANAPHGAHGTRRVGRSGNVVIRHGAGAAALGTAAVPKRHGPRVTGNTGTARPETDEVGESDNTRVPNPVENGGSSPKDVVGAQTRPVSARPHSSKPRSRGLASQPVRPAGLARPGSSGGRQAMVFTTSVVRHASR